MHIYISFFSWNLGKRSRHKGIAHVIPMPLERESTCFYKAALFSGDSIVQSQIITTYLWCLSLQGKWQTPVLSWIFCKLKVGHCCNVPLRKYITFNLG